MRCGNVDSEDGPSAVDEEDGCLGQQQEWCGVPACKGCPYGRRSDLPPVVSCSVEVGEPSLIYGYETTSIAEKRQRSRIRSCGVFGNEFS